MRIFLGAAPRALLVVRSVMSFAGTRVTVMGLGRFGGGSGVARWLAGQGARVLVTDTKPADQLKEPAEELADLIAAGSVTLRLGEHRDEDFVKTDLVIANPAVPHPWDDRYLGAAKAAGVPINTEIGLMVERLPNLANTIGITGTVGKSTTTAMITHALMHTDDGSGVALGGNIGVSLLGRLGAGASDPITERTTVVLELSSFMLHWLGQVQQFSPRVAVVTNIGDNHLDWHEHFDHYQASKQQLLAHQPPAARGGVAVLGRSVASWAELARKTGAEVILTDDQPLAGTLALPGRHNAINAAQALAACAAYRRNADPALLAEAIRGFPGLEHRLQLVRELRGVRYYNDSKCTTPDACLTAIDALSEGTGDGRIHLIAGGYDKHSDLKPVGELSPKLAGLYCIGATGPQIAAHAGGKGHVEVCEVLSRAVAAAAARARAGDVVLLSPACASWGQYANYEFRGRDFITLVSQL
jgi:UDP-N-acetylmuramoylalanine--D-glutamate ligase